MKLTKEQLMKGGDARVYLDVNIKDLGGEVTLGSLTAHAVLTLNELNKRKQKGEAVEEEILVLMLTDAVVNEAKEPMFTREEGFSFLAKVGVDVMLEIQQKTPAGRSGAANPTPANP